MNPLPVRVRALQDFDLDGQGFKTGNELTVTWLHCKRLMQTNLAEPVHVMKMNAEPIKDVLVFTPVYRLEPETVKAVLGLEWTGAITQLFQRDNPHERGQENHLHQYQRGREAFLAGRYDAMLVIESDIIPPRETIEKLAALQADLAYGVYRFRVTNAVNIFERYPEVNGEPARNPGESLTNRPYLLRRAVELGKIPCSGAGLGCVLIRRKVLEKIEFRREKPDWSHCDTWFTKDVLRAGFSMMADMSVICGHKNEAGQVLWPDFNLIPSISKKEAVRVRRKIVKIT